MVASELILRVAGMSALCLTLLMAPLSTTARLVVMLAASLGIGLAAVLGNRDRLAARLLGPAILVLAVVPSTGLWAWVDLGALAAVGFALVHPAGMSRAVPAMGLPLAALFVRGGEPVPVGPLSVWLLAVALTVVASTRSPATDVGPQVGSVDLLNQPVWRRPLLATVTIALVAVPSILVAQTWGPVASDALSRAELGADGLALGGHPGLAGGLDVGAPVELSDDVVLRVSSDRPLLWRGTTYDSWDGRSWSSSESRVVLAWSGDAVTLPDLPGGDTAAEPIPGLDLPTPVRTVQRFRTERSGFDVALGAWSIDALWTTARGATYGADGSVILNEPLGSGASWTAESLVVPATPDDLRRADPALLAPGSPILERYAVETDLTPEVALLARTVTAGESTTYDKVTAIEAWMDKNITYTRDIERLPQGADAVDHLLFDSRTGFCEQIGSAMVVMLRSLGIPARLVVGYVPGQLDSDTGEWLSRGTDAHTWAEIYFPGVGWQGFDPTAGVPLAASSGDGSGNRALGVAAAVLAMVGTVAAAAALVAFVLRRPTARRHQSLSPRPSQLLMLQDRFDRCGTVIGCGWGPATTLGEKGHALVAAGVSAAVAADVVTELQRLWYLDGELDFTAADRSVSDLEAEVQIIADRTRSSSATAGRSEHESSGAHHGRAATPSPCDNPSRSPAPLGLPSIR